MEPRSIERGNELIAERQAAQALRFNGATLN